MKTDLFQSYGHCWVFQICWHIECSTFIASSFRIWNSSTGIPSPPLALFVVILPKAHLTLHSRLSGSRWVITPSWLSRSWRSFLYSSVYACHLFLISSASVRSIPFLSFSVPIFAWNVPLVYLIFLLAMVSCFLVYACHKPDILWSWFHLALLQKSLWYHNECGIIIILDLQMSRLMLRRGYVTCLGGPSPKPMVSLLLLRLCDLLTPVVNDSQ